MRERGARLVYVANPNNPTFGAPGAIRVTAGTDEENELFGAALRRVGATGVGRG